MARMARVVIPDWPQHVAQRGNRRQRTLFTQDDYRAYASADGGAEEERRPEIGMVSTD